jgi:S1-C subfamily serine protease
MLTAVAAGGTVWTAQSSTAGGAGVSHLPAFQPGVALSGTATGIGPGLMLTNSHVVRGCQRQGKPIRIVGLAGSWEVRLEDADTDLALLSGPPGTSNAVMPLSAASRLPRGSQVVVYGFPADGTGGAMQTSTGTVLRAGLTIRDSGGQRAGGFVLRDRSGQEIQPSWEDGLRFYGADQADRLRWTVEVDAVVPAGSSGGPVLDAAGQLVGIIFAGDPGRRVTAVVPLDDVRDLLRRAGVQPRFGARSTGDRRSAEQGHDRRGSQRAAVHAVYQVRC